MSLRKGHTISLYKASDGTAATGMNVALVSDPIQCEIGQYASFQVVTPNGPVGTWSVEDSNDDQPKYNGVWDPFPTSLMSASPSQPAGAGVVTTTICTFCTCGYKRLKYTPTSAGTGILPTSIKAVRGGVS